MTPRELPASPAHPAPKADSAPCAWCGDDLADHTDADRRGCDYALADEVAHGHRDPTAINEAAQVDGSGADQ